MIEKKYTEAFTPAWIEQNINDPREELVILRKIIPWDKIIDKLAPFYSSNKGAKGISLRIVTALLIVLRRNKHYSDRILLKKVRQNRYLQYFCNIPDKDLFTFMHPSTLVYIRKRFGAAGIQILESILFETLRAAGAITDNSMLSDSTVQEANIIYPTDMGLIFKAFGKMRQFAVRQKIPLWWDDIEVAALWREYNLSKKGQVWDYFLEYAIVFDKALEIFKEKVESSNISDKARKKARQMISLLSILNEQNELKLQGEKHIPHRLVSLDEPEARPIKKGKSHPPCEFGTTLQLSFNRDGFMITAENFIGKPADTSLWPGTVELYAQRMKQKPGCAIGDLGYRSKKNLNIPEGDTDIFLGRSSDVPEEKQDFCRKARSATEGFIAVAKNLRGFGRSLYRGFEGDRIWTLLCQISYNFRKFLQLYYNEELEEECLIKLGLLS